MSGPTRRRAAALASALLAAVGLAALAPAARAQQKRYAVDSMHVVVAVQPDGSYRVSERVAYTFSGRPFTFAERAIPLRYIGAFTLDSIVGEGLPLSELRARQSAGMERLRWSFPPTTGRAVFRLAYTVRGALFDSAGRNVVDWDAVGRDWRVPMADVRATVLLPAAWALAASDIHAQPAGATITPDSAGWRLEWAYHALPRRTAYRVIVEVPRRVAGRGDWPGQSAHPAGAAPWQRPLPGSYAWLLPLAFVAGFMPGLYLFLMWRRPAREAVSAGAPPTSLERAGAMLPELTGAPARVFAAVIFDLAARGHLELRRTGGRSVFSQKKVEAFIHDDVDDPLTPFERRLLEELGRYRTLAEFGTKGRRYRAATLRALRAQLVAEGLLEEHTSRSWALVALAFACGAAGLALLVLGGVRLLPGALLLTGGLTGLLFPVALARTPSEAGALIRAQVLADLAWLRHRIEEMARTSPVEAAQAYINALPWLTLDTRVTAYWVQRITKGLKHADGELATPAWAIDLVDTTVTGSAAYAAFMPYLHVTGAVAGAAAPGSGAAGASAAGAGAGGGAGGGGGGAG